MRDFKSANIGGDVNIYDHSSDHKLLIHCTNDELLEEEPHRQQLLRSERSRKNGFTLKFLALCGTLFLIAAGWYYLQGQMNTVTLVLGVSSVLMTAATLQTTDKVTVFELRQINALREIEMILRERGVR